MCAGDDSAQTSSDARIFAAHRFLFLSHTFTMDLVNNYGSSDEEDHQETVGTMTKSSIQINATPDAGFDVSIDERHDLDWIAFL